MLQVRNLTIDHQSRDGVASRILSAVDFDLQPNEILGVLGESGCGKTTLALALLGVFHNGFHAVSGSIRFRNDEILGADEKSLQRIRGAMASMVFQEAAASLNPVMPIGDQVSEVFRAHYRGSAAECRKRAQEVLEAVRLEGHHFWSARPHELSSGQRQRVALAQALVCKPALLIADEPTSALDNVTQLEILSLLMELRQCMRLAILFITHDPGLLAGFAERVFVMYGGSIIEEGTCPDILNKPSHPYTEGLLRCLPPFANHGKRVPGDRLNVIRGQSGLFPRSGCVFEPRCPMSIPACGESVPPLLPQAHGGRLRCFRYGN